MCINIQLNYYKIIKQRVVKFAVFYGNIDTVCYCPSEITSADMSIKKLLKQITLAACTGAKS